MDQLIELLKQIQELAGVAVDALHGADKKGGGKPPMHGGDAEDAHEAPERPGEKPDAEDRAEGAEPPEGGGGKPPMMKPKY